MATLYIYKWNNYYNRRVKKDDPSSPLYTESVSLNFNPNDGVNTIYVAGRQGNTYDGSGDYVCYLDDNVNISSRWFIVEQKRTLKGQYQLTLHRDLLKDYYDKILDADVFVEKAILPSDNPLIYNDEAITTNQIKSGETLLKDATGCPWIVGYFDKTTDNKVYSYELETDYDVAIDESFSDWSNKNIIAVQELSNGLTMDVVYLKTSNFGTDEFYQYNINKNNNIRPERISLSSKPNGYISLSQAKDLPYSSDLQNAIRNTNIYANLANIYYQGMTTAYNTLSSYNNKILRFKESDGSFVYKKFKPTIKTETYNPLISVSDYKSCGLYDLLYNDFGFAYNSTGATQSTGTVGIRFKYTLNVLTVSTEDVTPGKYSGAIQPKTKKMTTDTPYGIFAVPYGNIKVNDYTTVKDAGFSWAASAFGQAGGTSNTFIYDVQLLPYCPVPQWVQEDGSVKVPDNYYSTIDKINSSGTTESIVSFIIYPPSQSFTLDIYKHIVVDNMKLENQCDFYRLCSPNYNGQFEFSVAKNGGLYGFNIDCTYKPYNPYIHVNPMFSGLYGEDYNDVRGLICQGDFSLPVMNDAWISYENTNKNYQNIFDRQIQNMDTNRKYQRTQQIVSAVAGTVSGGTSGAMAGAAVGGPVGAIIGASVGTVASAAGGIADIAISDKLYNESLDYTKDLFGYQLDNIKAQPQSVGKTTAFTNNNKYFPILEFYTCTAKEKIAVANKIIFNSMTVGVIGKPIDYINNIWYYIDTQSKGYFKCKLIAIDLDEGDFNIQKAIAEELYKGAYYTWE